MGNEIRRKFLLNRKSHIAANLLNSTVQSSDKEYEESNTNIPAKGPKLKTPNTNRNDVEVNDNDYDNDDDDDNDNDDDDEER